MSNKLEMAAITDPGQVRANNEDSVATAPGLGLAVLADGMGGHLAGEVASGLTVDLITRHMTASFKTADNAKKEDGGEPSFEARSVGEAIKLANSAIHEASHSRPECAGMGSTVVAALFYDDKICIAHVGDSRLYRLREGKLDLLTKDHSVVQELLSRGLITASEAQYAFNKNLVTRALGIEASVEVDIQERLVQEQDLYLLCSDGLNDVFSDNTIRQMLTLAQRNLGQKSLEKTAQSMVDEVNTHGGPDNISIILIRTGQYFQRASAENGAT